MTNQLMTNEEQQLCLEALESWGADAQIDLATEEMSELITKLCHFRRNKCGANEVAEEIADVMFMMKQLSLLFGLEVVESWITVKKHRLRDRIDGSE